MPHIPGHNINPFAGYVPTPPPMSPQRFPMPGEYPGELIYGNITPTVTTPLPQFMNLIGSEGQEFVFANEPGQIDAIPTLTPEQRIAAGLPAQTGRMGFFEDLKSSAGTMAGRIPELARAIANISPTNPRQYYNMYKTMTDPEATTGQKLLAPVMPALDVLSAAEQAVFKPFYSVYGGSTLGNIPGVYEGENFESVLKKYRDQGFNTIEASEKAFEEINLSEVNNPLHSVTEKGISKLPSWASFLSYVNPETFGWKGAIELAFDPFVVGTGGLGAAKKLRKPLSALANKGRKAPIDNATLRASDKPSTYFPDIPKEQPVRPVPKTLRREETYFPDKRPMTFFDEVPPRTPTAPLRQAEQYFPDTPPKKTPPKKEPNPVYDNLSKELETKQKQLNALSLEQSKRYTGNLLDDKGLEAVDSVDLEINQLQKEINVLKQELNNTPKDTFFDSRTDTPIDPQMRAGQYFPDTPTNTGIQSATPSSPTTYFKDPPPQTPVEPLGRDVESYFPQRQLIEDLQKTKPSQQKPRVPREGTLDDAIRPGELQGSQFKPVPGTKIVEPSANAKPFLGEHLSSGIVVDVTGKFDKVRNFLGGIIGDNEILPLGKLGIPTSLAAQAKPVIQKIFRWAEQVTQAGRSRGRSFKDQYTSRIKELSKVEGVDIEIVNDTPLFRHLIGVDETLRGVDDELIAPAIEDIAARYPKYVNNLSREEIEFFNFVKKELDPFNDYMRKQGFLEKGIRDDIIDGGFYMPRGGETKAITEGVDAFAKTDMPIGEYVKKPKGLGTGALPLDAAKFDSKAQGVMFNDGVTRYKYMNTGDAVADYIEAIYRLEANTIRALSLQELRINGKKIGSTYHQYLTDNFGKGVFPENIEISINKMRQARKNLINLSRLSGAIDERLIRKIDDILQNPFTESSDVADVIDDIKKALVKASSVQRGKYAGANKLEVTKLIKETRKEIDNLRPEYNRAIKYIKEMHNKTGEHIMELPGMSNHVWADDMVREMHRIIKSDPTLKFKDQTDALKAANAIGRGTGATGDNSAPFITLFFGWAKAPRAWAKGAAASLQSWTNPAVMGNRIKTVNKQLKDDYGIEVNDLYNNGLHHSGGAMEFSIGQEGGNVIARAGRQIQALKIPIPKTKKSVAPIEAANRAFSNAADVMRLEMMLQEMRYNKVTKLNVKEYMSSGQMREAATSINRITGYSARPFAGTMGELLMFAPRYFATRLENLLMGILASGKGAVPGVTLSIQERMQRQALLRFAGYGTGLTIMINEMLGNETDFNPIKEITTYKTVTKEDGRKVKVASKKRAWNPNFMTIRWNDRDYNTFGSSMQIVRLFFSLGLALQDKNPSEFIKSLRGISSPIIARSWDLITGETFEGKPVDPFGLKGKDSPITEDILNFIETFVPFALQDMGMNIAEAKQKAEREGIVKGSTTGVTNIATDFFAVPNSPMSIGDLLEDTAQINFNKNYYDLQSWQKDMVRQLIEGELSPFQEAAKERVTEGSQHFAAIDAINKERVDKLIEAANDKTLSAYQFYQKYKDIEDEIRVQKSAIAIEFEESGEGINDPDPNIRALARYHSIKEKALTPAGLMDWNVYDLLITKFMQSATKEQQEYILKNTNRSPIPYEVRERLIQTRQGRLQWQKIMQSHLLRQQELQGNQQLLKVLDDIFYGNTFKKEN